MKYIVILVGIILAFGEIQFSQGRPSEEWMEEYARNTADRVQDHGYPGEVHRVETEDNYVISMFRIPYSHNLQNQNQYRPPILLQHGLLSCSDAWIICGPEDSLAYLLADAGYDVWMGNARGNRYSRNNTRMTTKHPYFWQFSWHEIGAIDIASMIDYILDETKDTAVHYVGHSQGTTVFFVLMSFRPEYNQKIKTAHMLAPVAFMSNMSLALARLTRPLIGRPNVLTRILDTQEILPNSIFYYALFDIYCREHPILAFVCSNLYLLLNSGDATEVVGVGYMNMTASADLTYTHPAGASMSQVLHYMQEYESGHFRQFDHGEAKNLKVYGQPTPPDYDVSQITADLHLYYCQADDLADVKDVEHLATVLPKPPNMFFVPYEDFTHGDFAFATNVKEVINDRIIDACNKHEELIGNSPLIK